MFNIAQVDVYILQEHHINEYRVQSYGLVGVGDYSYFGFPALGQLESQAHICSMVASCLTKDIVDYKIFILGQAYCMMLKIWDVVVEFINVYDPNVTVVRCHFWEELYNIIPKDFNMVETLEDRRYAYLWCRITSLG